MKHSPKSRSGAELEDATRARSEERNRWAQVISSPEAAGRFPLATALLTHSNETAEKIRALLTQAPVSSEADAVRDKLAQFMHVIEKSAGAHSPPLRGAAAQIVEIYRRTTAHEPPSAA